MNYQLDDSNIVPNLFVGGNGGHAFHAIGTSDVQKLVAWGKKDTDISSFVVRAIEITWRNDPKPLSFGIKDGESKDLTLEKDERISAMELWGAGRVDKIIIKTDRAKILEVGGTGGKQHYMDVGSGFLEGFEGKAEGSIDRLKPRFSKLARVPQNAVVQNLEVGGTGGDKFWACRADSGTRISHIDFWQGHDQDAQLVIRGFQVTWEDGTRTKTYGTKIGSDTAGFHHTPCTFNLDPSNIEKITEMTVQGAGRVDRIEFSTSYGHPYTIGGSGGKPLRADVAGGVLLGFKGAEGSEVHRLAPIFMTKE